MKRRPFGLLLFLLMITAAVLGISRSGMARVGLGIYPEILSFTATPDSVHAGDPVTLKWLTRGVESVTLDFGPENAPRDRMQHIAKLPVAGTLKVLPAETTVYELSCETISSGEMCMPTKVLVKVN